MTDVDEEYEAEVEIITAQEELREIAEKYHEADQAEKANKKVKEVVRGPLLDLMSEVVRDEVTLQRRTEEIDANEDPRIWARRNFPVWNVVAVQPGADGDTLIVTLEENDQFKKYEFIHNGFKFGRTVRMKDSGFEVDEFLAGIEESDFPVALKKKLRGTIKEETVVVRTFDAEAANELMIDDPDTTAFFQNYMVPGKPEISLLPITKVKESDEV